MDENHNENQPQKHEIKLGRWGVVGLTGIIGILAAGVVAEVRSCKEDVEPTTPQPVVIVEDAGLEVLNPDRHEDISEASEEHAEEHDAALQEVPLVDDHSHVPETRVETR
jgi:hypothetical protein